MSVFWRKYATATAVGTHIRIPIYKAGSNDFATGGDWTPAAGDVKISKNSGAEANIATLPSYVNGAWEFTLSIGELATKTLTVKVVDAATKAVDDQFFIVETFGHASAMYQWNPQDIVRLGLSGLPDAGPGTEGGLPLCDANGYASSAIYGLELDTAAATALRANIGNLDQPVSEAGGGATASELASALAGVADFTVINAATASKIDVFKGEAIANSEGTAFTFPRLSSEAGWPGTLTSVHFWAAPNASLLAEDSGANYCPIALTVSSITSIGTTATATTATAHGLSVGSIIRVSGATLPEYNGYYAVASVPTPTTLTYTFAGSAIAAATGSLKLHQGVACTVTSATGSAQAFRLELTRAQTQALSAERPWGYDWWAVANVATSPKVIRSGAMNTRR